LILILSLLQDFSSRETDFYFYQFLSNFLKYFFSNFLLFYLYNIFAIYFPNNNSLFLKFFFSTLSNFSYCLTSILLLLSNSTITFFAFSQSFFFFQVSCSAINSFYLTVVATTSYKTNSIAKVNSINNIS